MSHRIREAMKAKSLRKLSGVVEADETWIGGSDSNRRAIKKHHSQGHDVEIVMGMVERGGEVRAKVIDSTMKHFVHGAIRENIEPGSILYTDESVAYKKLGKEYYRGSVNHKNKQYVKGDVHTNTIENF